jgi:hypothetical protein
MKAGIMNIEKAARSATTTLHPLKMDVSAWIATKNYKL